MPAGQIEPIRVGGGKGCQVREGGEERGGVDVAPQTARANTPPFSIFAERTDGVLIFQISTETTVENQSYGGICDRRRKR